MLAAGFALGVYALPILIAPEAPPAADVQALAGEARFEGRFRRDLEGSDLLHWGEGVVSEIVGSGDRAEAVVVFNGHGAKRLLLAWAPLEKV